MYDSLHFNSGVEWFFLVHDAAFRCVVLVVMSTSYGIGDPCTVVLHGIFAPSRVVVHGIVTQSYRRLYKVSNIYF